VKRHTISVFVHNVYLLLLLAGVIDFWGICS